MYLFENIKLTESIRFLLNMKQNAVFQKHVVFSLTGKSNASRTDLEMTKDTFPHLLVFAVKLNQHIVRRGACILSGIERTAGNYQTCAICKALILSNRAASS